MVVSKIEFKNWWKELFSKKKPPTALFQKEVKALAKAFRKSYNMTHENPARGVSDKVVMGWLKKMGVVIVSNKK
jgi:hypothetical protein